MSNYLRNRLETLLKVTVELSKGKAKYGDYSSNVFLKNKGLDYQLLEPLNEDKLIESYTLINRHLNLFISTEIAHVEGLPKPSSTRMFEVFNRLYQEGFRGKGSVHTDWIPLIKAFNLAYISGEDYEAVVQEFNKLDQYRIYRDYNSDVLCGIQNLLRSCLIVLERISDE